MDVLRIAGSPDDTEVAAVLAALTRTPGRVAGDRLGEWRAARRAALRRMSGRAAGQQTR